MIKKDEIIGKDVGIIEEMWKLISINTYYPEQLQTELTGHSFLLAPRYGATDAVRLAENAWG